MAGMEHPGLSVPDIKSGMALDEVQSKITDLHKKLGFAMRSNNQELVYQIQLALNTYQRAYEEMIKEQFGSKNSDAGGQIDIS